jgi:ABC-type dipeptide/oligopeptide/nickel transport system permease component
VAGGLARSQRCRVWWKRSTLPRLPGIGRLTFRALSNRDLPVIMATVLYGAIFVVLLNALVDILHARLDPRIRAT